MGAYGPGKKNSKVWFNEKLCLQGIEQTMLKEDRHKNPNTSSHMHMPQKCDMCVCDKA